MRRAIALPPEASILQQMDSSLDFTLRFVLAGVLMLIGLIFLAATRKQESPAPAATESEPRLVAQITSLLRRAANVRRLLIARVLSPCATMASACDVVYIAPDSRML